MKISWITLLMITGAAALVGQTQTPRIVEGITIDHQHARLTSAKITVTREDASSYKKVNVNEVGEFRIELPPGSYTIRIESSCFTPFVQTGVKLDQVLKIRLEVMLQVVKTCIMDDRLFPDS